MTPPTDNTPARPTDGIEQELFIESILSGDAVQDDAAFLAPDGSGDLKRIAGLDRDPAHRRPTTKRKHLRLIREHRAAEQIGRLPDDGEEVLLIMTGRFHGTDIVAAVLRLLEDEPRPPRTPPPAIAALHLTTMSINRQNAETLLAADERIGPITLIVSNVFAEKDSGAYNVIHDLIVRRPGSSMLYARNHTKIILALTTDGRKYYGHGSLNLRRCQSLEQFALGRDAATYDFFRAFIDELAAASRAQSESQSTAPPPELKR